MFWQDFFSRRCCFWLPFKIYVALTKRATTYSVGDATEIISFLVLYLMWADRSATSMVQSSLIRASKAIVRSYKQFSSLMIYTIPQKRAHLVNIAGSWIASSCFKSLFFQYSGVLGYNRQGQMLATTDCCFRTMSNMNSHHRVKDTTSLAGSSHAYGMYSQLGFLRQALYRYASTSCFLWL